MSQVFAWICLLVVASTSAYGVQLTAGALVPPRSAAVEASRLTSVHKVLIVAVDPVTYDRAQVECDTSTTTFASDVVIVDAIDFPAVVRGCSADDAPAD